MLACTLADSLVVCVADVSPAPEAGINAAAARGHCTPVTVIEASQCPNKMKPAAMRTAGFTF